MPLQDELMADWAQDLSMRRLRRIVAAVEHGKAERRSIHGVLAAMVEGDHAAAIMLEQILYWSSVVRRRMPQRDGWFWKTDEQWQTEVGLTQRQCAHSRKKALANVGVEMEKRTARGLSMTWHYRVSAAAFVAVFARALGLTVEALNEQVEQMAAVDAERKQKKADPRIVDLEVHESYTSKSTDAQLRDRQIVDLEVHESATPSQPYTATESTTETASEQTTTAGAESSAVESVVVVDDKDLKIWSAAFQQLELQLDAASFATWFRDATLLNVTRPSSPLPPFPQAIFTIGVGNSYAQQMLAGRMYRLVERVLGDVSGEKISAQFEVLIAKAVEPPEPPLFRDDADDPSAVYRLDGAGLYEHFIGAVPQGEASAIARMESEYGRERMRAALQITQARMERGDVVRDPVMHTFGVLRRTS